MTVMDLTLYIIILAVVIVGVGGFIYAVWKDKL